MRGAALLFALLALGGCISPPLVATGPEADYQRAALLLEEKRYQEAASTYRGIVSGAPESPAAADALFKLACLYVRHDNPQRDYGRALAGFDEFLKRHPDHPSAQEARSWRLVLKTALDAGKETERLKRSIELLKELDIRHEEQRRMR